MIDPSTSYITRAVAKSIEDKIVNARLVVGVCVDSDNESNLPKLIDGGFSDNDIHRRTFFGGPAKSIQTIIIESGGASENGRQVIRVAYSGEQLVNICGPVDLGDKLCISHHPGRAKSIDYLEDLSYFESRSIGKVIKFTSNKNQVKALLDIE